MNFHDSCPNCGYRKKPYLMSTTSEAPGIKGLWQGEGDPFMQVLAKFGSFAILFCIVLGILIGIQ